jgi:hypothetical protein
LKLPCGEAAIVGKLTGIPASPSLKRMPHPEAMPVAPLAGDAAAPAAERAFSIETYIHPDLHGAPLDRAGAELAAGRLVVIRNAFDPAFAERIHRSLDSSTAWRAYEGYEEHFHYHHHNLYDPAEFPPEVAWCSRIFSSPRTKAWAGRLSGRQCGGPAQFAASWYRPGDHSLPHTDAVPVKAEANRQVAFVWHLARDWRPEWGGALYWCPRDLYLPPAFNTLVLFNVAPDTSHFVTQVSPFAAGKRLAINGWWTGPGSTGQAVAAAPDRIAAGEAGIEIY